MIGHGYRGLSGGERTRFSVARALASGRPLLLLDEPVAHLDHPTAVSVLADVREAAYGRTVVIVSHRTEGLEHADRVLELIHGELEEDPVEETPEGAGFAADEPSGVMP
ncbi:UDP diphosphate synthase [Platysternon megacephalum]|uniref:UDP diphosphate synthase n=1 Tax=Platysternon megacephalum TaxID=55544 RepID=A0A4D9DFT8_9SAUR|nr:UDP diphosphate synthase [Platysternon megacephalum]